MAIEPKDAQDVFKDAGENIIFTTQELHRKDYQSDRDAISELAERLPAIINSMNIRYPDAHLSVAFGIGSDAWDYLFPNAPKPKQLEPFTTIPSPKHDAVATGGDLFYHIRAKEMAVCYEVMDQLMQFIGDNVTTIDETHGFRYFEGRAIIGFIDGTENPAINETAEYALVGDEDPEFENGSYAFSQKYIHAMDTWNKTATEEQEKTIGRKKFSDLELRDAEKPTNAHNVVSQDNEDGVEHKIVRMNVPYANPGEKMTGTYFIGYSREWAVTKRMLTNMFVGKPAGNYDHLLDFSEPTTGALFFIPSKTVLTKIAEEEI
ncbi:Dyp-type peroxidase [Latilactobacillus fuchuensis]|uniref:Peroxidase family protein n=1 Tax=Latilactobacillus fuchuensis TaxID=164393 RepID=A0A2N9DY62_9LACO|nr:Dyp-type peroxidase [Latilactobacillus fuchuensis]MCP8857230.1 Dyp-type peroxidase [Latilactobacillus fuchuensis]SPC39804.1 Peroxidase family protein [Latilactobacillus fuchuensis]